MINLKQQEQPTQLNAELLALLGGKEDEDLGEFYRVLQDFSRECAEVPESS
jgi:hypothetical protein